MKKLHIALFIFYYMCQPIICESTVDFSKTADMEALLAFKVNLDDSSNELNSWNQSTQFCRWVGVTCSSRHADRVIALDLPERGLVGSISPSIGNLTFLRRINLTANTLYGKIPFTIGLLRRLEYLSLKTNYLGGKIPVSLRNCTKLVFLDLGENRFIGEIPSWVGSLYMLKILDLPSNNFTGSIPSSVGNLSSLSLFNVAGNYLQGKIPEELGLLDMLQFFQVAVNNLTGTIPYSLYNKSSLTVFNVVQNYLIGSLPDNIGNNLPNIEYLHLGLNFLTGPIPSSLSNASTISYFDLTYNNFNGQIPPELGKLCPTHFSLQYNQLEATKDQDWEFLRYLSNCSNLQELILNNNKLGGTFPNIVANLSTKLQLLYLKDNYISGKIPHGIGNLANLETLNLYSNRLTGAIPESVGKLTQLKILRLHENYLSGPIPFSIGNLTQLTTLEMYNNNLDGQMPESLGNLQQLNWLNLFNNSLNGTLPETIFNLSSLSVTFDVSYNLLSGKIPMEVGHLTKVANLILDQNNFFGDLPKTLVECESLERLTLSNNLFSGIIPPLLGNIKGLRTLDLSTNRFYGVIPEELGNIYALEEMNLSHNNLSGNIPMVLENLRFLHRLDLSFNNLKGQVPTEGVFSNITALTIHENEGLCGGLWQLHLPPCANLDNKMSYQTRLKIGLVIGCAFCLILSLIICIFLRRKMVLRNKKSETLELDDLYAKISYAELVRATDLFSTTNLIGAGRYGSVYKGTLTIKKRRASSSESAIVAIKVFNLKIPGTSKSFFAECDTLRRIRHRNLISVRTCCSSCDSQGNDFKAIVFDFMPNGSLETWLHSKFIGNHQRRTLNVTERMNIMVDIAIAVDYLHNCCEPSIIHCDLKPSNILLDEDFTARLGDFGLARLLPNSTNKPQLNSQSSIGIRGTIGYIAPEYGSGAPVSTLGDVYSFGIILLETLTGRAPTDDMFKGSLTLPTFVEEAFPERLLDIIDPNMISSERDTHSNIELKGYSNENMYKHLVSTLAVGLMCSQQSPSDRKSMDSVAMELQSIRASYNQAMQGKKKIIFHFHR
ncbi:hypothetical protein LUZ63_000731 [Rhynchospora breviuscula]|uniref:Receptor kinase-like protein Xa21 n=1 Tax=Rhynchospora breviuscula TaxID=2022672 RepID=A0A9Q0CVJ6_9POAL|nr:hypothetical protein LUZ63_000731 [Rhynchospora breviuscula]